MKREKLQDSLDGLFAYDGGCTDSGIKDELLRMKCKEELQKLSPAEITVLIRDMWWSDEALAQGYGAEDAFAFMKWLGDEMDYDL